MDLKTKDFSAYLIIALLVLQVAFSGGIIWKLSSMVDKINKGFGNQSQAEITEPVFVKGVSEGSSPALGPKNAPVTIIEFADYECPACGAIEPIVSDLLSKYDGKIRFVFRNFPLITLHSHAMLAAQAAVCAGKQNKYWQMHDLIFLNQTHLEEQDFIEHATNLNLDVNLFNKCLTSSDTIKQVKKDIDDGERYGVKGTPTFFINGYRYIGVSQDLLSNEVDLILKGGSR